MKIEEKNIKMKNNIETLFNIIFFLKFIEKELHFIFLDERALNLDFILSNHAFV
jgi:hypothetical protein